METEFEELFPALELDKVRQKIASFASCEIGGERILQIRPFHDVSALQLRLQEVARMMELLRYDDPFPIHGIEDIRNVLTQASVEGSTLTVENLISVAKTLAVSQALYRYLGGRRSKYPQLVPYFRKLSSFLEITRDIAKTIDFPTQEIKDNASPELAAIRKSLRQNQGRVRKKLNELVERYKDFLQEPIITIREGRMVIPLRENAKGQVKGFIHDRSASGATLFIEPTAVFEMNNRIREMELEERQEIGKLLLKLTSLIRDQLEPIKESFITLCQLDELYAIGRFGVQWQCAVPKYNPAALEIIRGYHPLLLMKYGGREKVVPLDVTLDEKIYQLIITGPNAGGKTVALKTIGLAALMFQCGLPVFAEEQSQFPVFDRIFVDIGDLQSIEQDLSTFSAHVAGIARILTNATDHSLVLLDEIGTGTDPAEGAALAMAFLEKLHERRTKTVVTTHQGALKAFAYKLNRAENASMAFDDKTLKPTYHFRVGIPGSSYAFEIARRLGLPDDVVAEARKLVGASHGKLEKFILELEQKLNHHQQLLAKAEIQKTELAGLTKLYREKYAALQKEEKQLKRKAAEESKAILDRANSVIEAAVREIRAAKADKQSIKSARSRVESVRKEVEKQLAETAVTEKPSGKAPSVGDTAYWQEMNV
ncbi:MAG TPA: endonuclease MutS2, partial [Bacteroidetes bacterium]|nr:endonuclease MutS2 [Bacteroidota bacterium]